MAKNLFLKKDKFAIIFLFAVSLLIVFFWFKDGSYIAGGETNLSIWNADKTLNVYKFGWIDLGLGYSSPFWLPRLPFYLLANLLNNLFDPVLTQAIIFGILIFVGGVGMYLLAKHLFEGKDRFVALLAAGFYILNLYAQSQIWARFIIAGFFTWACFPLFLYFWMNWIENGKRLHIFIFLVFSLFVSSAFSHPAFMFAFWLMAVLFSFFKTISKYEDSKTKKLVVLRTILGITAWIIFNIWWIYPYIKLQDSVISNIHDWKYDLASLVGVSVDSTMENVLLLRHKFFFERLDYWGNFYKSTFSYLISMMILGISALGFIKAKVLKEYKYLVVLVIVGFFICKGTNPPFGVAIFSFLFEYIPLARVFRSSYEKFGTVWLMMYSIFFAYGFKFILQQSSRIWKFILTVLFIPLFFGVLVWPMWKSGPFSPQARVFIPNDYNLANTYLNNISYGGRILSLPIIPGEGVRYDWGNSAYYGLEPSDILFSKSTISNTVRYKYADDKYMEIYNAFIQRKEIDTLLSETDIEYLVLHNELDPSYSNASSSAEVKETLKRYPSVKFLKSIGFLDIYTNTNFVPNSHIVIEGEAKYSYKKVNSGRYIVNIINAKEPFKMILKDSFGSLWSATINNDSIDNHFVAYGYANGWAVDKKGSYTVDLIFEVWPKMSF